MSDDFFDDDDSFALDDAAWQQIDALAAAQRAVPAQPPPPAASGGGRRANAVAGPSRARPPPPPPHGQASRSSGGLRQTTLFGDYASSAPATEPTSHASSSRAGAPAAAAVVDHTGDLLLDGDAPRSQGLRLREGKAWDRLEWAKEGANAAQRRTKGKGRGGGGWDGDDDNDDPDDDDGGGDDGFDQFPAPANELLDALPTEMKHALDLDAAQTWVYPINLPLRDYQYNIVRASLFRNTLAALPTGLGKTFIAGCVMLNYARWFPTAKIVFVAPTKPLVNQQAQAFPETCGFLNDKIAVLNGDLGKDKRAALYPVKQVFFMTAQTMMNDLRDKRLDARDIVLLVVDEAHKATGEHAYVQVVRYLQAHNHLFRILALTATPSGKPEGVQLLIDRLHLSHIEIRDEESLDLRQYVHKKTTELVLVRMTPNVLELKEMLEQLMRPIIETLIAAEILQPYQRDPARLHAFHLHSLGVQLNRQKNYRFFQPLKKLEAYARAMDYLLVHSISMFQTSLAGLQTKKDTATSKNAELRAIDAAVARMRGEGGFVAHAKMDRLKALLLEHFAEREDGDGRGDLDPKTTRVMVFCSFRACLEEVVTMLKEEQPLLRPVSFVGQSTDASGTKGLKQSEQLQVIRDFKAGVYNVMVATSIGEEGLDIGSVDKIICYDASKSSVRMLQRVGRTGRKREGSIFVLMGEGREEDAWSKAKDNYQSVQVAITNGATLELYDDVPRLLPAHIKPTCVQKVVPIDTTVPDFLKAVKAPGGSRKVSGGGAGGGKQTKLQLAAGGKIAAGKHGAQVPDGAADGFVFARDLTRRTLKGTDSDLEDDSDDEAISRGIQMPPSRRAASAAASTSVSASNGVKGKPRAAALRLPASSDVENEPKPQPAKRARTDPAPPLGVRAPRVNGSSRAPAAALPPPLPPSAAHQDLIEILDDDDDEVMLIDESLYTIQPPKPSSFRAPSGPIRHRSTLRAVSSASIGSSKRSAPPSPPAAPPPAKRAAPSFSASPSPPPIRSSQKVHLSHSPEVQFVQPPEPHAVATLPADLAAQAGFGEIDPSWILDDDDDDAGYDTSFNPSPRPPPPPPRPYAPRPPARAGAAAARSAEREPATPAPLPKKDIPRTGPSRLTTTASATYMQLTNDVGQDMSWVLEDDTSDGLDSPPIQRPAGRARPPPQAVGASAKSSTEHDEMPPPASTRKLSTPGGAGPASAATLESPFQPTQPVRRTGFRPKMRNLVQSSPVSPALVEEDEEAEVAPPRANNSNSDLNRRLFSDNGAAAGSSRSKAPRRKGPSWYRGAVPDDVRRYLDKNAADDRDERRRRSRRGSADGSSGTVSDDGSAIDDEETSSDRAFAGEFQPTQAPRGYDQRKAYMQSILSPLTGSGLGGGGGVRGSDSSRPAFGARGEGRPARRFERVASEGPDVDGGAEDDDWDYGTFVVDDEEPLMYDGSSSADGWMRK